MSKTSDLGATGPTPPVRDPFPIAVRPEQRRSVSSGTPQQIPQPVQSSPPTPEMVDGSQSEKPREKPKKIQEPVQRSTVELLPGRFEPVEPIVVQQEIRFLKAPEKEQVVTLGWNLGEPPEHVTINHSSVQPVHARLTYRVGNWWIESLSENDPVKVNRISLAVSSPPLILVDGDLVRIGAVSFRFCFP